MSRKKPQIKAHSTTDYAFGGGYDVKLDAGAINARLGYGTGSFTNTKKDTPTNNDSFPNTNSKATTGTTSAGGGATSSKSYTGYDDDRAWEWKQSTWTQCSHYGFKPIAHLSTGTKLYGASRSGLDPYSADLVIDLAGNLEVADGKFVEGGAKWEALNKHVIMPEVVRLHWQDYGIPPVDFEFWEELLYMLDVDHVTLTCFGGHGRTGTAMAALMVADGVDPTKAINYIRATYCDRAIETNEQEDYIKLLAAQRDRLVAKRLQEKEDRFGSLDAVAAVD